MPFDFDWSTGRLAEGLQCYRSERFWHAHEHWEDVWRQLDGREKLFLQALIQTTAAFHHVQRRNFVGAASLLRNALRKLDPLPDEFGGVAINTLRLNLRIWVETLDQSIGAAELSALIPFPEIR